jgi:hypothetical protein
MEVKMNHQNLFKRFIQNVLYDIAKDAIRDAIKWLWDFLHNPVDHQTSIDWILSWMQLSSRFW